MLNLRSISLARKSFYGSESLELGTVKSLPSNRYVGFAGAPICTRNTILGDHEEDFLDLDEDEEDAEAHEVSDDPFMTGIVAEIE